MRERNWAIAAGILMAITLGAAFLLPVPYVTLEPGPTFDVLGERDGTEVIAISGAETYPTTGRLAMTTVSQIGGNTSLTMGSALAGWLLPDRTIEPRDVRYPPGSDAQQERQIDEAVFEASSSSALAAAAGYLGRPVESTVLVSSVEPDSPADGILESGDEITAVNGTPTASSVAVGLAVRAEPVGSEITVDYVRDGDAATATISGGPRPDGGEGSYLGVLLVNSYSSDFTAEVSLDGIGGPSAGMIFALGMVDKMTPEDLLGDGFVAGTGTIDAEGLVGPIGGIDKKMIAAADEGAGLFLAPRGNCADVAQRVPDGLTVAAVGSLSEAIDSIKSWRDGAQDLPSCAAVVAEGDA